MASARPKKTASRKAAKKATAAKRAPAKKATVAKKSATKAAPRRKAASAADSVDEQLARYRSMRDFSHTAEPSGAGAKAAKAAAARTADKAQGLPFVIQKHAASHLHYDFRLGWNGVLKSWAVAKGPSYVTADKRLAVQVEDHPMEYGGFEGISPRANTEAAPSCFGTREHGNRSPPIPTWTPACAPARSNSSSTERSSRESGRSSACTASPEARSPSQTGSSLKSTMTSSARPPTPPSPNPNPTPS